MDTEAVFSNSFIEVADEAIAIYEVGASNPSGIARWLMKAIDAGKRECDSNERIYNHRRGPFFAPARLILAQLRSLMDTTGNGDYDNEFHFGPKRDLELCKAACRLGRPGDPLFQEVG